MGAAFLFLLAIAMSPGFLWATRQSQPLDFVSYREKSRGMLTIKAIAYPLKPRAIK